MHPFSTRNSTTTRSNFGALKSLAKFFRLWSFSHLYKILLTHRGEELCGVEVDTSKFGGKISKMGGKISAAGYEYSTLTIYSVRKQEFHQKISIVKEEGKKSLWWLQGLCRWLTPKSGKQTAASLDAQLFHITSLCCKLGTPENHKSSVSTPISWEHGVWRHGNNLLDYEVRMWRTPRMVCKQL